MVCDDIFIKKFFSSFVQRLLQDVDDQLSFDIKKKADLFNLNKNTYSYKQLFMPIIPQIKKLLFKHAANIKMLYPSWLNSKKRALLQARIHGTTFTGHPTSTTAGNTIRAYCM